MYVVVQHRISDPATAWAVAGEALAHLPAGVTLHHTLPNADGTAAVCLWEAGSVDTVRDFVEPAIGHLSRNEYFAVGENARGLPAQSFAIDLTGVTFSNPIGLVEEAVRNWEAERARVIAEVENIPEEHFDHRPAEGARSVRELALHVAEMGNAIVYEVLRPEGDFMHLFDSDLQGWLAADLPPARTRAEILELLRATGEEMAARLRAAGDRLTVETMPTLTGIETRLSAVWFGVGHEMGHRSQLATCARAAGQVPALTRKLTAMLAG